MTHTKSGAILVCIALSALSTFAQGIKIDTINVFSHKNEIVVTDPTKGENHYSRWVVFPSNDFSIRKITMYVHFACPDTMRCADWDYADHIRLERIKGVKGDSLGWELGRIITPYGGFYGSSWQFTWQTDVTDFSLMLRDSVKVNFIHTGYEPNHDRGWKVSVQFEIITGLPSAFPVSITQVYNQRFEYGNKDNPIEKSLVPYSFNPKQGTSFTRLRVLQTGHGMDQPDNCGEFCSKYRELWFDGKLILKRQMWMECGDNPVYPQAGTWIFDRANWCPGYLVQPETFDFKVKKGNKHSFQFVMEPYTATVINQGAQIISTYLIDYSEPSYKNDVSIEDIIVPSAKSIHSRKNPSGANAQIVVRNVGNEDIKTITIKYGTNGFAQKTYNWTGSLAFNQTQTITLPGAIESTSGNNRFRVTLENPNGKPDQYPHDNSMVSHFSPVPVHGSKLVFYLLTNNQPEQNGWQLIDEKGKIVKERKQGSLSPATIYLDTLTLKKGAYSLVFTDDDGDGLEFWYNTKGGRGEARLLDEKNNLIKAFESDCGSGWIYNFVVGDNPNKIEPTKKAVSVYPTRTSDKTTLTYFANTPSDVTAKLVTDPEGEIVEERLFPNLKEGVFTFDLTRFPYGRFYLKVYTDGQEILNRRIRFVEPEKPKDEHPYIAPKDSTVAEKLGQWQDWKFGVIIHWGPYSQWGIVESWSLCPEDEPWCERRGEFAHDYSTYIKEYEKIREIFNPTQFDPDKWAKSCQDAGMKYVVFTTKHHDGFSMFDTKYSDYKITDSKSIFSKNQKSNIVKEVFTAFRKHGMGIGAYFSKPDWHNDDYWWPYFPNFDRNVNYDPQKYPERWKRFQNFTYNQIDELMTDYGGIDILWLDGGWVRPEGSLTKETRPWLGKNQWIQDIDMQRIAKMAREHQPGLLIVDRTVHGEFENYRTPEQQVPNEILPYPWESCITLGDSWYSTGPNERYKSAHWAIHTLVNIVAKGGNFLLGIGPDKTGAMVPEVYQRLDEIGKWMNINGEAIYNSTPLAPYKTGKTAFTQGKDGETYIIYLADEEEEKMPSEIYIHDFQLTKSTILQLLGTNSFLKWKQEKNGIKVLIPTNLQVQPPCKHAWVIKTKN